MNRYMVENRFYPWVLRTCRCHAQTPGSARSLANDIMAEALRSVDETMDDSEVKSCVYAITMERCRDDSLTEPDDDGIGQVAIGLFEDADLFCTDELDPESVASALQG